MEAKCFLEKSVAFERTIQRYKYFPEDITLYNCRYESLKFYNFFT
jgi:hypothetical protein